jgi:hypothetical protein
MPVTPTSFKELFPEFTSIADARVTSFLNQAARRMDAASFGALYDDAQSYLTAHLLTIAKRNEAGFAAGASGPLTSVTVGPLSKTFSAGGSRGGAASGDGFEATPYGVEYLALQRITLPTPTLAF